MNKFIYFFGGDNTEANSEMVDIVGGKGANLAQMCLLGLNIPAGFTIATDICKKYNSDQTYILKDEFISQLNNYITKLENLTGKKFGDVENPLLISVRSGSVVSMPGMMDTVLNLGVNDEVVEQLALKTNNPRYAYDCYRRFIEMYGTVVLNIPNYHFEEALDDIKLSSNLIKDSDLTKENLLKLIAQYKDITANFTKSYFTQNPFEQLIRTIEAVLKSWNSDRAKIYRKIHNIDDGLGTAVNIQSMVFGNKNDNSGTGVVFTRNPSTGENKLFGEYLINAQGEDVVAGIRTPQSINDDDEGSLKFKMFDIYNELRASCAKLENHFKDMQDIEFTIDDGKLYILQTRNGKRSAAAALKIAVDMVDEGLLSKEEALMKIEPESLNQLLHTAIDYSSNPVIKGKGLPASPGASTGIIVFSPYDAEELSHHHKVILVRNDTSPEDIKGMYVASAILTARGGMTSHAAVVARGMGKPCVCGVQNIFINEKDETLTIGDVQLKKGDIITIDGSNGNIIIGEVSLVEPKLSDDFQKILSWADEVKKLHVRANAETVLDTSVALKFGAKGIGLCRTEHMFFDENKIPIVREMIIAPDEEYRNKAIEKLKPLHKNDFVELFKIIKDLPINIRLLDPPLHEFLPTQEKDKNELAKILGISKSTFDHRLHALGELNPMLGHRGCRLGISYPEIYKMQVEAILEASYGNFQLNGIRANIEIMIPLISDVKELIIIKSYVNELITHYSEEYKYNFDIKIGTMIELPRAALLAGEISKHVEYFSFGSNDLTQTTFGISRDDVGSFMPKYLDDKIFLSDPFIVLDELAVGELIKIAVERGKKSNPDLKLGICGEHAGNPQSIDFLHRENLDYISCSPYRIPIARLAAAQSKIKAAKKNDIEIKNI